MLSLRQAAKAPLVVAARARQVPVPRRVVARAAALQVVQAAVLGLAQAVQQVALVVELPAEQVVLLEVQVVPQAELLAVQPEAQLVV